MTWRFSVQSALNAARAHLARLGRLLSESRGSSDMIFSVHEAERRWKSDDRNGARSIHEFREIKSAQAL